MAPPMSIPIVLLMCCCAVIVSAYTDNHIEKPVLPVTKKLAPGNLYKPSPSNKPEFAPSYTSLFVEGVVLCESCKFKGSESVQWATPLPGAKVKLACQAGSVYKTYFSATARSDYNGFFIVRVQSFNFQKFSPLEKNCKVSLVYSPYAECSTPTDINNGKTGASLCAERTYKAFRARYSVQPLVFASAPCKRPLTYYKKKPSAPGYSSQPPAAANDLHF